MTNNNDQKVMKQLRELTAIEQIKQLKARYATAIDTVHANPGPQSAQAFANLFTEDAVLTLPAGTFEGRAAILAASETSFPAATRWSTHYVTNPIIEVGSATEATGEWYVLLQFVPADPPGLGVISVYGRYDEIYRRCEGEDEGWLIAKSVATLFIPPDPS
ncbi:nuclear transport factor 2 family protein [Pseudenhygromyxa sp. WMMC2535]|uniref:nuclear transport factor 2 family protein n=1 Tax=Pseudenhygromyxa sp. WMMC2535 TaxID=2712867 RepID=UPI001553A63D|nr:nuclear transport factor 2 family protein [Pseudenhygromyxa sp. WMMC2535]NVB37779.1 nuclear transport factor 2 family protein [Pseudenhygromyxa sp. WMMC2535]